MNAPALASDDTRFIQRQLDLLGRKSKELAARVSAGQLQFIDAVDMAYSAAEWAGLIDTAGDDAVQTVLADAFMGIGGRT